MYRLLAIIFLLSFSGKENNDSSSSWIRINQLGYIPGGVKVAVWCSKDNQLVKTFKLVDAATKKFVFSAVTGKMFGAYGPFKQTCSY